MQSKSWTGILYFKAVILRCPKKYRVEPKRQISYLFLDGRLPSLARHERGTTYALFFRILPDARYRCWTSKIYKLLASI